MKFKELAYSSLFELSLMYVLRSEWGASNEEKSVEYAQEVLDKIDTNAEISELDRIYLMCAILEYNEFNNLEKDLKQCVWNAIEQFDPIRAKLCRLEEQCEIAGVKIISKDYVSNFPNIDTCVYALPVEVRDKMLTLEAQPQPIMVVV